jgi:hypothetical protein
VDAVQGKQLGAFRDALSDVSRFCLITIFHAIEQGSCLCRRAIHSDFRKTARSEAEAPNSQLREQRKDDAMKIRAWWWSALIGSVAVTATAGIGQGSSDPETPAITVFDAPGAGTSGLCTPECGTYALAINPKGTITGYLFDDNFVSHAFVRERDGAIETFDFPGAGQGFNEGTLGTAINAEGTVVGLHTDENEVHHGFLRTRDGSLTSFSVPGNVAGTYPVAIADSDVVAGNYLDTNNRLHGFLRDREGKFHLFDPPGSISTSTEWLNERGEITGIYEDAGNVNHGFLRKRNGKIVSFDPPGSVFTLPRGINAEGAITGYYVASGMQHGFLRSPDGDVLAIDPPDSSATSPTAINAAGTIIGSYAPSFGPSTGFVRDRKGAFTIFLAVFGGVDQNTVPLAINRRGAIAGYLTDDNGVNHGFVRSATEKHCEEDDRR